MDVQGVLFDSGDTLIFPRNGSWWPGPDFEPILHRHSIQVPKPRSEIMIKALQEGDRYLSQSHFIANIEQERDQFRVYYQVICRNLGLTAVDEAIIDELASAYVDGCNVELYPDTAWALEHLTDIGITLGVLSDAWPSLETKFDNLGIRKYFKSFTVSAKVGCYKPNEAIYKRAISEIGIETSRLLFVDDDVENVKAGIQLGMNGVVMLRSLEQSTEFEIPFVRDLKQLVELFQC